MRTDILNYILTGTQIGSNTIKWLTPDALMRLYLSAIEVNSNSIHMATHEFIDWRHEYHYQYGEQASELHSRAIAFHSEMCTHFGAIRAMVAALSNEIIEMNDTLTKGAVLLDDAHGQAGRPLGDSFMPARQMLADAAELMRKFESAGSSHNSEERQRLEDLFSGWKPDDEHN